MDNLSGVLIRWWEVKTKELKLNQELILGRKRCAFACKDERNLSLFKGRLNFSNRCQQFGRKIAPSDRPNATGPASLGETPLEIILCTADKKI